MSLKLRVFFAFVLLSQSSFSELDDSKSNGYSGEINKNSREEVFFPDCAVDLRVDATGKYIIYGDMDLERLSLADISDSREPKIYRTKLPFLSLPLEDSAGHWLEMFSLNYKSIGNSADGRYSITSQNLSTKGHIKLGNRKTKVIDPNFLGREIFSISNLSSKEENVLAFRVLKGGSKPHVYSSFQDHRATINSEGQLGEFVKISDGVLCGNLIKERDKKYQSHLYDVNTPEGQLQRKKRLSELEKLRDEIEFNPFAEREWLDKDPEANRLYELIEKAKAKMNKRLTELTDLAYLSASKEFLIDAQVCYDREESPQLQPIGIRNWLEKKHGVNSRKPTKLSDDKKLEELGEEYQKLVSQFIPLMKKSSYGRERSEALQDLEAIDTEIDSLKGRDLFFPSAYLSRDGQYIAGGVNEKLHVYKVHQNGDCSVAAKTQLKPSGTIKFSWPINGKMPKVAFTGENPADHFRKDTAYVYDLELGQSKIISKPWESVGEVDFTKDGRVVTVSDNFIFFKRLND